MARHSRDVFVGRLSPEVDVVSWLIGRSIDSIIFGEQHGISRSLSAIPGAFVRLRVTQACGTASRRFEEALARLDPCFEDGN